MGPAQLFRWIMAVAIGFAALCAGASASASASASAPFVHVHVEPDNTLSASCHAASGLEVSLEEMVRRARAAGRPGWTCSQSGWTAHEPVAWLLFEKASWRGEKAPRYFFSRVARHRSVTFAALDEDGSVRTLAWREADAQPMPMGPVFRLDLPALSPATEAVVVRIERPHSVPLLTEARLVYQPESGGWSEFEVILIAFVLGMLVLPLLFDLSFFIVLRERFVLLHAAMVVAMMGYILNAGGLIAIFPYFSLQTIAVAGPLSWAIGVGCSALFLSEFLEPGAQSRFMRGATLLTGAWSIAVPGFFAFQFHATQSFADRGYFIAFLPVIAIISAAIIEAVWRGSRSARFLAVAWTPIILASADRLLRGLGVYVGPSSFDLSMYLATGLEVIVISLAIADRFFAIRRERDAAVTEARMLEQLSTRDPLTGLLNRRGLETSFGEFIRRGFDTVALIDLDRFKQVNDRYGHQIGDAALVACARALEANHDPDLVAVRLGGEEFVVLLRGQRTIERAEALRKAIPLRIAADVEGLDGLITASSGVIEVPRASNTMLTFDALYARADALMYEAKASGRNRMLYERLTVFADAPRSVSPDRRAGGDRRATPRSATGG